MLVVLEKRGVYQPQDADSWGVEQLAHILLVAERSAAMEFRFKELAALEGEVDSDGVAHDCAICVAEFLDHFPSTIADSS